MHVVRCCYESQRFIIDALSSHLNVMEKEPLQDLGVGGRLILTLIFSI